MSDNDNDPGATNGKTQQEINGMMQEALKAYLIIEQQQDILKEIVPTIADFYAVNKVTAKKILMAYAKDTLEKTSEQMENERSSLSNAEVMITAVENISVTADTMISAIENLVIEPPEPV